MLIKCNHIINIMNEYAPLELAENWDNVGLIIGDENSIVEKILVCLDVDDNVIDEAIEKKCNMIISHHPIIFSSIKSINNNSTLGKKIIKLIKNNINVYCAHTNLDITKNGTNDTFASLLNLKNIQNMFEPKDSFEYGLGRIGEFEKNMLFSDIIQNVKNILNVKNVVISGNLNKKIKKVAICTGSGGEVEFIKKAVQEKCDLYITGDIKYHNSQFAKENDICLIDASHYYSEVLIVPVIVNYINSCAKRLNMNLEAIVSDINGQTLNII